MLAVFGGLSPLLIVYTDSLLSYVSGNFWVHWLILIRESHGPKLGGRGFASAFATAERCIHLGLLQHFFVALSRDPGSASPLEVGLRLFLDGRVAMAICLLVALPLPVPITLVPALTPVSYCSAPSSSLVSVLFFCFLFLRSGILKDFPNLLWDQQFLKVYDLSRA